ncbi:hypothetical protein GEOBRER4_n3723 [Citrifermentans bremense]|uniref:Uncharacterized protein n=1 Tax=Citrifermentans bremense TaxID=60035 RepID=A0A7R7FSL7_9BACT|nr:hypothetical protein GEOBRER4_n3723 [Citrifermentans bremense]
MQDNVNTVDEVGSEGAFVKLATVISSFLLLLVQQDAQQELLVFLIFPK